MMTMTSFLQRMIWRGGDNDRHNVTIAESQCIAEQENKKLTMVMSELLENRSQSVSNIAEVTCAASRRPSTLRLFGNSKKNLSDSTSCRSPDSQGLKSPANRLVEDVVREFEDSYKSPTKTSTKKSKNFVKKLVAALERKYRDNDASEIFDMSYSSGPIYAYESSGTIRKSEENCWKQNETNNHVDDIQNVSEKSTFKTHESTTNKSVPKIIGAFLKKPVEVDDTSIYWIPITSKKLPRKKSFKKLLAKLTGRNGGKRSSETKSKQVVFASQENLVEEIHDSGYEERSTSSRTSSLTSFADTLMYHDNDYVDKEYRDSNFSTFVTSSPMKKPEVIRETLVNKSRDLSKMFPENKTVSKIAAETREDSGYISNHSILEESTPKENLVATRVQQISYQLAKLPKHPFARSEPRLHQQNNEEYPSCGEIITLRRFRNDEPIYDIPQTRPRSSIFDESLSMKRRNVPIQTVPPFTHSAYPAFANLDNEDDDEQPHYATVKPRNSRTYISYDNLCPNVSVVSEKNVVDQKVSKKSMHSSYADLTANESFVITMYV